MSEENKSNLNITVGAIIIAVAAIGWFAFSGGNNDNTDVATTNEPLTDVVPAVVTVEKEEIVEELIVTADPNNLPSDEELEKANAENAE